MTSYAAHLRVYEPLAAFPPAERSRLETYIAAGPAPAPESGLALEHQAALRALARLPPTLVPDLPEQAFVTSVDDIVLVCPWRTTVRAWEALVDIRDGLPDLIADAFVPRSVAEQAETELARWQAGNSQLRSHMLTSPWQIPPRWFVLVDPDEREVRAGAPGEGPGAPPGRRTGRSLVYRTAMSRARRRVARALSVLRRTLDDGAVTGGVEDLGRWLEEFHPRSLVELDYGRLAYLMTDDDLAADESARDVAAALAALGQGRGDEATEAYGRVTARMSALQAVESAN